MSIDLSIAIVNWNTREYLKQCLQSIRDNVSAIAYEVIVVDNASSDGSTQMVREVFPEVRLIENKKNMGFAKGNNQAFTEAGGRNFLLLNPDTIIKDNSFKAMATFLDIHLDAGAIAPRYLNPDGSFQRFYNRFPGYSVFLSKQTFLGFLFPKRLKEKILRNYSYQNSNDTFDETMPIEQPAASCFMVKKSLFRKESLFDEKFPLFFNDVDLCKRIYLKGYRIYFLPEASIIHFKSSAVCSPETSAKLTETEYVIGWLRYIKKYLGIGVFLFSNLILLVSFACASIYNLICLIARRRNPETVKNNLQVRLRIILDKSNF